MGVEPRQDPAAPARCPRQFIILSIGIVRIARLGGAALEQDGCQHHIGCHLQEFAFPVLEQRREKVAARQIGEQPDPHRSLFGEFLVVDRMPRPDHAQDAHQKQRSQGNCQTVVPKKGPHRRASPSAHRVEPLGHSGRCVPHSLTAVSLLHRRRLRQASTNSATALGSSSEISPSSAAGSTPAF